VIIYLAALLSVPTELYDAAEVDGASIWNKIWHVTLPHLRGILFITLILQFIATAQLFTEPFLFTGGGPANSTTTVLLLIYHYAFQNSLGGDYGMAAALSVMLAAFLGVFTAVYFWLTRSWKYQLMMSRLAKRRRRRAPDVERRIVPSRTGIAQRSVGPSGQFTA